MSETETPQILHAGDNCLIVEFGRTISLEINARVQELRRILEAKKLPGIRELVPTYRSLAVYFDPLTPHAETLASTLAELASGTAGDAASGGSVIVIPVCYGGEFGPDIANVAEHNGLTVDDVISLHSGTDYYCYMLGFTPGFSYLGGMDERIATPRLQNPRTVIPAGSVGIAGKQTGIYPIDSPGGWQLIGRTPLKMFDPEATKPTLMEAGLWVRFSPVSEREYGDIEAEVNRGGYEPVIVEKGDEKR
jgi:KipI family sensor histidine kinase inhibitor